MGTLTAPQCAMPRSATVHSRRVAPISAAISPLRSPSARRPQAASSAWAASSPQESGVQLPATLRTAAMRCPSRDARNRNRSATELSPEKSSFSFCIEAIV